MLVASRLATLDANVEGTQRYEQRRARTRDALSLLGASRRFRHAATLADRALWDELMARGRTDVCPQPHDDNPYPYTAQLERERQSTVHLRGIRLTDKEMAFHCAGPCCQQPRTVVTRRAKDVALATVDQSVTTLAAARDAPVCYVKTQRRTPRPLRGAPGVHGTCHHLRQYRYNASLCTSTMCGVLPLDADSTFAEDRSVLAMSASNDGSAVAWTSPDSRDDVAALKLFVWTPGASDDDVRCQCVASGTITDYDDTHHRACDIDNEDSTSDSQYNHSMYPPNVPLNMWWTNDGRTLAVAWSTTIVHPMGHDAHDGDDQHAWERYLIATYEREEDGRLTFLEATGPHPGRLIATSASASGERVVCLVRRKPTRRSTETMYRAVVHYRDMTQELRHPEVWKNKRRDNPEERIPYLWGPSAVGMSPNGDCVVVVHRTRGAVLAEVFDLDEGANYVRVNAHALTEWLSLSGSHRAGDNAVKLRYAVRFSGCGRFACVVDQRSRWRYHFTGYAAVVVDLGKRRTQRQLRCYPLCYYEELDQDDPHAWTFNVAHTTLRAIDWTPQGAWVMSNRGALIITEQAPTRG